MQGQVTRRDFLKALAKATALAALLPIATLVPIPQDGWIPWESRIGMRSIKLYSTQGGVVWAHMENVYMRGDGSYEDVADEFLGGIPQFKFEIEKEVFPKIVYT